MAFELDLRNGSSTKESSSLFHDAMDHVKTTWSNVLSGKASVGEYAEVAVEAAVGIAAGGLLLRQGAKLFAAQSRIGPREPELLNSIRQAARGEFTGVPVRLEGLPNTAADPAVLARIKAAAKGEMYGGKTTLISSAKDGFSPSGGLADRLPMLHTKKGLVVDLPSGSNIGRKANWPNAETRLVSQVEGSLKNLSIIDLHKRIPQRLPDGTLTLPTGVGRRVLYRFDHATSNQIMQLSDTYHVGRLVDKAKF